VWTIKLVFQQDSAPSHTARKTLKYLRDKNVDFISPDEWPPYSPDLNPLNFSIWSNLEMVVYRKPIKNLEELERLIKGEWEQFDPAIIKTHVIHL
jgi:hypothetical protein